MIKVDSYSAWVYVDLDGVDNDRLEFILREAEEREERECDFYADELLVMIRVSLMTGGHVSETEMYGHLAFNLVCGSPEDLQFNIAQVEKAVALWADTYRIHRLAELSNS